METVLSQLNAVPGVIGSLVCDTEGRLLAQAFPPMVEQRRLQQAAALVAERTAALETSLGGVGMVDLRYVNARVIVQPMQGGRVLFLCAPTINLQFLALSASGALRRLEKVAAERALPARRAAARNELHEAVQRVNALIEATPGDHFKLRGKIALKAGFALDLVDADSPDDPVKLEKLKAAASAVLGRTP
jgi:predicted regulator of Ras-like GTPase activity (Roadblock/LC7/MglB family)